MPIDHIVNAFVDSHSSSSHHHGYHAHLHGHSTAFLATQPAPDMTAPTTPDISPPAGQPCDDQTSKTCKKNPGPTSKEIYANGQKQLALLPPAPDPRVIPKPGDIEHMAFIAWKAKFETWAEKYMGQFGVFTKRQIKDVWHAAERAHWSSIDSTWVKKWGLEGKPQLLQHPNDPYFIPNIEAGHRFEGGYGPRIPIPWEEPMPSWQLEMEAKANPDENMTAEQSTQASIDAKQNSSVTSMIGINEIVHPHGWQHVNEFDSGVHQFGHAHATAFAGQQGDVINVEDSNITTALTQVNEISHKHDAAHHATSFAPQISPDGDRLTWVLMPDEETQTAFVAVAHHALGFQPSATHHVHHVHHPSSFMVMRLEPQSGPAGYWGPARGLERGQEMQPVGMGRFEAFGGHNIE